MKEKAVLTQHAEGVTTITLNRPEKLNALSARLLDELNQALQQAAADSACRCVMLTGSGRGFSAGADLGEPPPMVKGQPPDFGALLETGYHPVIRAMRGMRKPVVAAVNGTAAGAGCNIALAADLIIAARSARFIQSFIRIGLVPDASGTWTIPRLIGRARALQWMMSGDALDAETAERWGLINSVIDDASFAGGSFELARKLAAQPTLALAAIKRLVDASAERGLDEQLALEAAAQSEVGRSADTMEGISAFIQKRTANFRGS